MKLASTFLHIACAVCALVLVAPLQTGAQQENAIAFEASDYGFTGPDRVPSGLTAVQIHNTGAQLHHIQLVKLGENKTAEDFTAALRSNPSALPAWLSFMGGPNAVTPGAKAVSVQNLEAGQYLLLCLIPNESGVPHVALGMQKSLVVTPTERPSQIRQREPEITITERDFAFDLSRDLRSGRQTIGVVNSGTVPHEVVLVKLVPGKSIQDFAKFGEHPVGPPPGQPLGGIVGLDAGHTASFTANLQPGTYGLICFLPDPESGAPHFSKGMMLEFAIKK
jgi:uncharacterized cupredoxin-like copper-binding protein